MLNQIDPGRDGEAEPFGRGRVRLRQLLAGVRGLDDDALRLGREADECRLTEVTGAAVLDEVRPLVQIGVDGLAQFRRGEIHQRFAGPLRDLVVHPLLEQRQSVLPDQTEAHRVRPAPSDDVAGDEHARAHCLTARDAVADADERRQHPVAVAHRGDAPLQLDLRRLEDELVLAIVVADQRLVALVDTAVERQVDVRVDEAGNDESPRRVDDPRPRRSRRR